MRQWLQPKTTKIHYEQIKPTYGIKVWEMVDMSGYVFAYSVDKKN